MGHTSGSALDALRWLKSAAGSLLADRDAALWVSVGSMLAAWGAAWFAYLSAQTAKRSLSLSERQEERRVPRLLPYLAEGYCKTDSADEARLFAFSILVRNPTDIDNSLAQVELVVNYTLSPSNVCMAVRVPHDAALASRLALNHPVLSLPV